MSDEEQSLKVTETGKGAENSLIYLEHQNSFGPGAKGKHPNLPHHEIHNNLRDLSKFNDTKKTESKVDIGIDNTETARQGPPSYSQLMKISEDEAKSKDEADESSAAHDSEMSKILEQKMNVTLPESREDEKRQ